MDDFLQAEFWRRGKTLIIWWVYKNEARLNINLWLNSNSIWDEWMTSSWQGCGILVSAQKWCDWLVQDNIVSLNINLWLNRKNTYVMKQDFP